MEEKDDFFTRRSKAIINGTLIKEEATGYNTNIMGANNFFIGTLTEESGRVITMIGSNK